MDFGQGGEEAKQALQGVIDGDNNQGTAGAHPTTNEVKTKGHMKIN